MTEVVVSPPAFTVDDVFPDPGTSFVVTSTSANDTEAGTGARLLSLDILDDNFKATSVIVAMNGTTGATVPGTLSRFQAGVVVAAGSLGTNEGTISIGDGPVVTNLPTVVRATIGAEEGRTEQANFTVPKNRTALFDGLVYSASALANVNINFRIRLRGGAGENGESFISVGRTTLYQDNVVLSLRRAITLPEKTDVAITAMAASGGNNCAAILLEGFSVRNSRLEP